MQLAELEPMLPVEVLFDMRYATTNNVLGEVLYRGEDAVPRLDEPAAKALVYAAELLIYQGFRPVIWDAFRPKPIQARLTAFNRDPHYVLDVESSNHPKGLAVDLTLADMQGNLLDMGTDFDNFTPLAHAGNTELDWQPRSKRGVLAKQMESAGFRQWPYEWWHFDFLKPPPNR
jgi:D-alanyl-D-alanine dipeptidase